MIDAYFLTLGAQAPDVALTLNRVALGTFFMISGYHKLFTASRHATLKGTLQEAGASTPPSMRGSRSNSRPIQRSPMSAVLSSERPTATRSTAPLDMKLEVVVVPVSDVDRAKQFYLSLGWRLDADFAGGDWRIVQMTPTGSAASFFFGKGLTKAAPGSAPGLLLVVDNVDAARAELLGRGVEVSEVFHFERNAIHFAGPQGHLSGPEPERRTYLSFAEFSDPDGNGWVLQEITSRLPGRGVSSMDISTLVPLLRETEQWHGKYEPNSPKHHWSEWYAAYMVARERGKTPEVAAKEAAAHIEGA